jgi:hypothetical protein
MLSIREDMFVPFTHIFFVYSYCGNLPEKDNNFETPLSEILQ